MTTASDPDILRYAAFAATPEGGNPAGIVLHAAALRDGDMLRIAAAVGYAETAFVVAEDRERRHFRLRYWSPAAEVPFCGHATVAAAVALAERDGLGVMTFETQAGEVALTASAPDGANVDATRAVTVSFVSVEPQIRSLEAAVLDELLALLGLERADLHPDYPPLEAYAGNWHPMIVLQEADIFHQFRFSPVPVARLARERGWTGTITVLHPHSADELFARNLFPVGRMTEDPATGSAAAATGAYLRHIGRTPTGGIIRIHQGAHVGRPSLLTASIPTTGGIVVTGGARALPSPAVPREGARA